MGFRNMQVKLEKHSISNLLPSASNLKSFPWLLDFFFSLQIRTILETKQHYFLGIYKDIAELFPPHKNNEIECTLNVVYVDWNWSWKARQPKSLCISRALSHIQSRISRTDIFRFQIFFKFSITTLSSKVFSTANQPKTIQNLKF